MFGVLAFCPPYNGRSLYVQSSAMMIRKFGRSFANAPKPNNRPVSKIINRFIIISSIDWKCLYGSRVP